MLDALCIHVFFNPDALRILKQIVYYYQLPSEKEVRTCFSLPRSICPGTNYCSGGLFVPENSARRTRRATEIRRG